MSVTPGRGHFWCSGECGKDEICRDSTWQQGYCLNPDKRRLGLPEIAIKTEKPQPTCGAWIEAG
jgi:hypothetical protein